MLLGACVPLSNEGDSFNGIPLHRLVQTHELDGFYFFSATAPVHTAIIRYRPEPRVLSY